LLKAVIFANGKIADGGLVKDCIHPDDFLIAANGGYQHIKTLALKPNLVIGDLDSLTADERQAILSAGVEIKLHPAEKDKTDLELALEEAIQRKFSTILIVAALGGRLDQTLGNLSLLAAPFLKKCTVSLEDGSTRVWLITRQRYPAGIIIDGHPGDRVSLIAFQMTAKGILTHGLKYPLHFEDLQPFQTRGISNQMIAPSAEIRIEKGQLLVLHSRIKQEKEKKGEKVK